MMTTTDFLECGDERQQTSFIDLTTVYRYRCALPKGHPGEHQDGKAPWFKWTDDGEGRLDLYA